MTWFELPLPPSANALTRNVRGRGRVNTAAYNAWLSEAVPLIHFAATGRDGLGKLNGKPAKVSGHYALYLRPSRTNPARDLGNLWKATEDALKKGGMIDDDSLCQKQESEWVPGTDCLRVLVLPTKDRT
jgi:hypothetical protein